MTPRPAARRRHAVVALVAVVLAVLARGYLALNGTGFDSDEAVTGIMAQRMTGGQFNVFFLGQSYNSSVEQFPQALAFALGAPQTPFVLRAVVILLAAATCWVVYLVGREIFDPWRGCAAALLFAVGPYYLLYKGTKSYGSYGVAMLLALVGVLVGFRLARADGVSRVRWATLLGLLVGLVFYANPTGYYLLLPAVLWATPTAVRDVRASVAFVASVLLGLTPVLFYAVRHSVIPLPQIGAPPVPVTVVDRIENLFTPMGAQFLGLDTYDGRGWGVAAARIVAGLVLVALAVAVVRQRRSLWRLVTLRRTGRSPADVLVVAGVFMVAAVVVSRSGWLPEPRYVFEGYPVLVLGLVGMVPPRPVVRRVVTGALVVAMAAQTAFFLGGDRRVTVADRVFTDCRTTAEHLEAEGQRFVYAPYWTAYTLQFCGRGELTVGSMGPVRIAADRHAVDDHPVSAWVVANTEVGGVAVPEFRDVTARLGLTDVRYRIRWFGQFAILDRFTRPIRPWEVGLADLPANFS